MRTVDQGSSAAAWIETLEGLSPAQRRLLRALAGAGGRASYKGLFVAACPEEAGLAVHFDGVSKRQRALINRVHQLVRGLRKSLPEGVQLENVRRSGYALVGGAPSGSGDAGGAPSGLEGLPAADAEATALMAAARELAAAHGHGYVGLEHLALALLGVEGGGPVTAYVRSGARLNQQELQTRLMGLQLQADRALEPVAPPAPTRRLASYASQLPEGFGLDLFWHRVCLDDRQPLRLVGRGIGVYTRADGATCAAPSEAPPTEAVIALGPEDGRVIGLQPGTCIGRAWKGGQGAASLYGASRFVDKALSRDHLRYLGGGQFYLKREAVLMRDGERLRLAQGAEHHLVSNDVLWLTSYTCLMMVEGRRASVASRWSQR